MLQEFYDFFVSVLETAFGHGSALAPLLLLPISCACISCMMRLIKLLLMGTMGVKRVETKHRPSGSDWEEQLDVLFYEHDESCRNVKAILEEKKR